MSCQMVPTVSIQLGGAGQRQWHFSVSATKDCWWKGDSTGFCRTCLRNSERRCIAEMLAMSLDMVEK